MNQSEFILAIDQGTSSTKALFIDKHGQAVARGISPLKTFYGDNGFVEQDPEAIWKNVKEAVQNALSVLKSKGVGYTIKTIAISNQRETFVVWDKTGKPLHNAIVWQCKRSVTICADLLSKGLGNLVKEKTGLLIDPYFSATKLIWLVQNNRDVGKALHDQSLYFGTVDTWLLYKMTNGKEYATDHTNASRTMLFNLTTLQWDDELIVAFGLDGLHLPKIQSSADHYGETDLDGILNQKVNLNAMIGDSHAAAFGEGCVSEGIAKATLGTGCSILMNVGTKRINSMNGMVSTICWSMGDRVEYALEGVIVSCGSTIEWLKRELNLFSDAKETEDMAKMVHDNGGIVLIPAFSGLGSPYWQMERRASISGINFGTTKYHIVRAALESVVFQIADILKAMEEDSSISLKSLLLDGGMSKNAFLMQSIADILVKQVKQVNMPDVSALGAGWLAGLQINLLDNTAVFSENNGNYMPTANGALQVSYQNWQKQIQK